MYQHTFELNIHNEKHENYNEAPFRYSTLISIFQGICHDVHKADSFRCDFKGPLSNFQRFR